MMSPVVNEALCATLLSDLEGMRKGSSAFVLTYAGLVLFLHAQLGTQIGTRSIVYAHKHTHTHTHTRTTHSTPHVQVVSWWNALPRPSRRATRTATPRLAPTTYALRCAQ